MRIHVHDLLREQADLRGDAPALTYRDVTIDYARLYDACRALAAGLRPRPRARRPRRDLARQADSRPSWRSSVPRSPAACSCRSTRCSRATQVAYILDDCDVRVLITTRQRWEPLRDDAEDCRELARRRARRRPTPERRRPTAGSGCTPVGRFCGDAVDPTAAEPAGDRPRHGGDPLHLGQHRPAEGRRARPPQPDRRRGERQPATCGNTADDVILSALPLSFDAGLQPADDRVRGRRPRRARELPARRATSSGCARKHGVTGLTCVPPLWIQLAEPDWPEEATASPALLRQHRRPDAASDARPAARDLPAAPARS